MKSSQLPKVHEAFGFRVHVVVQKPIPKNNFLGKLWITLQTQSSSRTKISTSGISNWKGIQLVVLDVVNGCWRISRRGIYKCWSLFATAFKTQKPKSKTKQQWKWDEGVPIVMWCPSESKKRKRWCSSCKKWEDHWSTVSPTCIMCIGPCDFARPKVKQHRQKELCPTTQQVAQYDHTEAPSGCKCMLPCLCKSNWDSGDQERRTRAEHNIDEQMQRYHLSTSTSFQNLISQLISNSLIESL